MTGLLAVAAVALFAVVFATVAVLQEMQDRRREKEEIADVLRELREHWRRSTIPAADWLPAEDRIPDETAPQVSRQMPGTGPAPRSEAASGASRNQAGRTRGGGRRRAA